MKYSPTRCRDTHDCALGGDRAEVTSAQPSSRAGKCGAFSRYGSIDRYGRGTACKAAVLDRLGSIPKRSTRIYVRHRA